MDANGIPVAAPRRSLPDTASESSRDYFRKLMNDFPLTTPDLELTCVVTDLNSKEFSESQRDHYGKPLPVPPQQHFQQGSHTSSSVAVAAVEDNGSAMLADFLDCSVSLALSMPQSMTAKRPPVNGDMNFLMPELARTRELDRLRKRGEISTFQNERRSRSSGDLLLLASQSSSAKGNDASPHALPRRPHVSIDSEEEQVLQHLSLRASNVTNNVDELEMELLAELDAIAFGGPAFNIVTEDPSNLFWAQDSSQDDEIAPQEFGRMASRLLRNNADAIAARGNNSAGESHNNLSPALLARQKSVVVRRRMTPESASLAMDANGEPLGHDLTRKGAITRRRKSTELPDPLPHELFESESQPLKVTTLDPLKKYSSDSKKRRWLDLASLLKSPGGSPQSSSLPIIVPLKSGDGDDAAAAAISNNSNNSSPKVIKRPRSASSMLDAMLGALRTSRARRGSDKDAALNLANFNAVPGRLPPHMERQAFQLAHQKLAAPKRPLLHQVVISNMVFAYLKALRDEAAAATISGAGDGTPTEEAVVDSEEQYQRRLGNLRRRLGKSVERGGVIGSDKARLKNSVSEPTLQLMMNSRARRHSFNAFSPIKPSGFAREDAKRRGVPAVDAQFQQDLEAMRRELKQAVANATSKTSKPNKRQALDTKQASGSGGLSDMQKLQEAHRRLQAAGVVVSNTTTTSSPSKQQVPARRLVDLVVERERKNTAQSHNKTMNDASNNDADDDDDDDDCPLFELRAKAETGKADIVAR